MRKSQELKHCTFRPHTTLKDPKKRTLDEFIHDQMRFEETRKSKQVVMAEQAKMQKL